MKANVLIIKLFSLKILSSNLRKIKYFNLRKLNEFTLNLQKKFAIIYEIIFLSTIKIIQL